MKLASIVPINNITRTFDGDYAMLLTHLADYYPKTHHKNCYVIMDNSLIELGNAASIDATYEAAVKCHADEIILPDVYRNYKATITSVKDCIQKLEKQHRLNDFKLMAVCQGATPGEFVKCFCDLEENPYIHTIGIPKVAATLFDTGIGRPGLESIWSHCTKEIHLLGCWSNLSEFKNYKYPARIRSCDTCIPAILSRDGVSDAWAARPEKTIDFMKDNLNAYVYEEILEQLREERLV